MSAGLLAVTRVSVWKTPYLEFWGGCSTQPSARAPRIARAQSSREASRGSLDAVAAACEAAGTEPYRADPRTPSIFRALPPLTNLPSRRASHPGSQVLNARHGDDDGRCGAPKAFARAAGALHRGTSPFRDGGPQHAHVPCRAGRVHRRGVIGSAQRRAAAHVLNNRGHSSEAEPDLRL